MNYQKVCGLMRNVGDEFGQAPSGMWAEKFAELIMRDMYEVMKAESEGFDLVNNFGAVQGIDVCMRKVKQHFGVEE